MICEIVNPSDPYSLVCDDGDFPAAAVAIALVGRGQLGLRSLDDVHHTPVLFGWDEWLKSQGLEEDSLSDFIAANLSKMAGILETVEIGSPSERAVLEETIAELPKKAREKFRAKRLDRLRSSINDIGSACWNMAELFRRRAEEDACAK